MAESGGSIIYCAGLLDGTGGPAVPNAAEEAHAFGRLIVVHCRAKESMVRAIEAGLDLMEHAEFLDPDGVMRYDPATADAIGFGDQLGTLTPGKLADLIAVEGDPGRDISALGRVRAVILGGQRIL